MKIKVIFIQTIHKINPFSVITRLNMPLEIKSILLRSIEIVNEEVVNFKYYSLCTNEFN